MAQELPARIPVQFRLPDDESDALSSPIRGRHQNTDLLKTLIQILNDLIAKADSNVELGIILKVVYSLSCARVLPESVVEQLQAAVDRCRAS
jgi:hypothetical protein